MDPKNDNEQAKDTTLAVEDVGADQIRAEHAFLVKPEALLTLSDSELASLGRKATLKLDCFIMPCMTLLYILNYLDRQVKSTNCARIK